MKDNRAAAPAKKPGAFGRLSKRERTMIAVLVILVVLGALGYFVAYPALQNYTALTADLETLQSKEMEYRNQIAQTPAYQKQYDEAKAKYDKYLTLFYTPMDPEMIDATITSMLLECNLSPTSLSMVPLQSEAVPVYVPVALVPDPVPPQTESSAGGSPAEPAAGGGTAAGTPAGSATGPATGADGTTASAVTGADGTAAAQAAGEVFSPTRTAARGIRATAGETAGDTAGATDTAGTAGTDTAGTADDTALPPAGGETSAPSEAAANVSSFVYTIDINATGSRSSLFTFLEKVAGMSAIEVTMYDFTDPMLKSSLGNLGLAGSGVKQEYTPGYVNLQIKLYVFIEGASAQAN
ncbi:MAG: hypothetical protein LBS85_07450 [Clostridiales Family XIII bacterium]|nr:hypothetical protein [Clostridiales Family XIII bacterium]